MHRAAGGAGSPGDAGSPAGPWLASLAMWATCLRFLRPGWMSVGELEDLALTGTNLDGMRRWGYVEVRPRPGDHRVRPPARELMIRPTRAGSLAQREWRPLPGVVEERWQQRFGASAVSGLRDALAALAGQLAVELPDFLPILGYGLLSAPPGRQWPPRDQRGRLPGLPLVTLLSRVLLALAAEFEGESGLSLAAAANVLRVADEQGVRLRDIPVLAGVSKEAVSMAAGLLGKAGLVAAEADQGAGRGRVLRLTARGRRARDTYHALLAGIEERWRARYGETAVRDLRESLERLAGPAAGPSPLLSGLLPYTDGWRSRRRPPGTLPHYPMVLHRGGFPDGS